MDDVQGAGLRQENFNENVRGVKTMAAEVIRNELYPYHVFLP